LRLKHAKATETMAGWLCIFALITVGCFDAAAGEPQLPIAVIGDTQRTSWLETIFMFREENDRERELLLQHLFRTKFSLLVHLGDMVFDGASASEWKEFDRLFAPVFAEGIPFIPAMGNHEYWGNNQQALANLTARFPRLANCRWQACIYDSLGLIVIDSNISEYAEADWARQVAWFEGALQEMEANPNVRAVLTFSHHPPFTNSTMIDDASHLAKSFLPAFFAARKTMAFISGHVHGYERFAANGRTFIVSGGGGGPRLRLLERNKARHQDLFFGPAIRPFNYLLLYPEPGRLRIEVMGLDKAAPAGRLSPIRMIDEMTIIYPRHGRAATPKNIRSQK
ncbi:MAG: metallophosphoesterase family protein, partial [bacterium]